MVVEVAKVRVELLHDTTASLLGDKADWDRKVVELVGWPLNLVCVVGKPHCKEIPWRQPSPQ